MTARALFATATLVLAFLPGCFTEYNFKTDYTPEFVKGRHRVSVLGVFKDGRMDFESWDALSTALSAAFSGGKCAAGYSSDFVGGHAALAAAVDDVTRADGLGDDLLTVLSPAATGDLVVVFTVAGRVEKAHIDIRVPGQQSATSSPGAGGAGPSGQGGAGGAAGAAGARIPVGFRGKQTSTNYPAMDLSATLYSVSSHSTVGVIELEYTGENGNDAITQFAAKVRATIPGSTCEAWNWSVPIDEQHVRDLVER